MEIQKATNFIEDAMYDDHFAEKCMDWYENDVCLVLTPYEIDELHRALNEWVASNNIVKVNTVAGINNQIRQFLEETRNDEGGR